jgi:predicted XRE-type DNA-binding protein
MRKADVLAYYKKRGGQVKLAEVLGITQPAVSQWGPVIPKWAAEKLRSITRSKLKFDAALYDEHGQPIKVSDEDAGAGEDTPQ